MMLRPDEKWEVVHSNWELSYFQIKSFLRWKSISENQKISKKICEIPTHRKATQVVKRRLPKFRVFTAQICIAFGCLPFGGTTSCFASLDKAGATGSSTYNRFTSKRSCWPDYAGVEYENLGSIPLWWNVASFGRASLRVDGCWYKEIVKSVWNAGGIIEQDLSHIQGKFMFLKKGCFLPAAMSRWTISCLFRHWIKFYSSSHLLRHRLVRQNWCHHAEGILWMSSDAQCCRRVKCLISTSSSLNMNSIHLALIQQLLGCWLKPSHCWGFYSASVPQLLQEMLVANMDLPMGAWKWGCWVL